MKETLIISFLVIIIYIFLFVNKNNLILESTSTGTQILVNNDEKKKESAELLGNLIINMYKLKNHLAKNKEKLIQEYKGNLTKSDLNECIELLDKNFDETKTKIYENPPSSDYTSYSVNKGEELAFCLRSKRNGSHHKINLLMYVAIHEMAHIGCREIGHTELFKEIFAFYTNEAIKIKLYKYEDYDSNPVEYCGMILSSSIIN